MPPGTDVPPRTPSRPPRVLFYSALVPAAGMLLWNASLPGFALFPYLAAMLMVAIGGVIWLVRFLRAIARRRAQPIASGDMAWYLVGPVAGLMVLALAHSDVPLRARWALGKSGFERAVFSATGATGDEWNGIDAPSVVGTYRISHAMRGPEGFLFYHETGAFLDDAGFAYLPAGPSPDLETGWFENPEFVSLGDGWYSWTAGW